MGNLIALLLAIAVTVSACGSRLPNTFGGPKGGGEKVSRIEGSVQLTDLTTLDLAAIHQPMVLMFVTYFCISCKEEAANLAAYFAVKSGLPSNVRFITVLAGGDAARAAKWAQINNVSWTMAADANAELFERLCPEQLTPCVLTQNLLSGAPIQRHIGLVAIDQLEKETGPWVF